ncbi:Tat (twin-arginine translocation) pathway signal sequence [Granulicella rosea]|uniref:Tat (Twin-arginine translocation) pathway signal sequence n=1 Tax=Granulicella rosea TaxID=474952 RepID=A0A239K271_9BACT|nr:twin-arginine translocation signal domain-containing protein [Granulicella rosea]SNT12090.1 Tat (twin-arginine translocation) pathway signal sequence [Granulicella rosea]
MSQTTRRDFLKDAAFAGVAISTLPLTARSLHAQGATSAVPAVTAVDLRLLDKEPTQPAGVSWGVPWARGSVSRSEGFRLESPAGNLPLQSWPLAYWPDGSVKWTGFATALPAGFASSAKLIPGAPTPVTGKPIARKEGTMVHVDTGAMQCDLPLAGANLIEAIRIGGKEIGRAGRLVCILQSGTANRPEDSPERERFVSELKQLTVEQTGPVRAVVRIEGVHRGVSSHREWLPFTVRLYFYTGQTSIRLVHTIVFDGDQEKDFIRGLGFEIDAPMRDQPLNRTVRFVGHQGGLWSEPLQPGGGNAAQESGQPFSPPPVFAQNAIWNDFKLSQPNPDGFTIVKRTGAESTWIHSASGTRAAGLASVGDLGGGLAVSIRNFWQSFPAGLEIQNAASESARLIAWLWSPEAPEMDMRFYDTHGHGLPAAYEDAQPGLSTAYGVARTSELSVFAASAFVTKAETVAMATAGAQQPIFAASPEYLHSADVFGVWSLPDRSTPFKKSIEDGLDSVLAYYERQVEERRWYGFWQYGDFIHSYSAARHVWHYDWGGHAWDNTELGAPLWLWYSFLRTGRADLFRLAEAHARNTSETDTYHLGPMRGLGSRHNVVKWGDGAKEARISQAAHWRPFYYLTTDERTGDLLREAATHSGVSMANFDPMREVEPKQPDEPPVRIRIGPDWFALAGNWMTEWERTGDKRWQEKILAGIDSILTMPFGLETGKPEANAKALAATVGFDDTTGKLTAIPNPQSHALVPANYNLATIQGGGEVMFELVPLLGRKDFEEAWLKLCRLGIAPSEVWEKDRTTHNEGADAQYVPPGQSGPRLAAYVYARTGNVAYAKRAIEMLLSQGGGIANPVLVTGSDVLQPVQEDARMSTNEASQTSLQCIEVLELCKDQLPHEAAVRVVRDPRNRSLPPTK